MNIYDREKLLSYTNLLVNVKINSSIKLFLELTLSTFLR